MPIPKSNSVAVRRSNEGSIIVVTLNRPSSLNSLSAELVLDLARIFERISELKEVKCVILTGTGRAFCSGIDLTDPPDAVKQADDSPASLRDNPTYQMSKCPVPIIAAINGHCITGGFELALACDILIGSTEASFRDTHVKFGLAPCWGLSQKFPRIVGSSRAQFFSYTAEKIDAKTAYEWGLLAKVVNPDELMPTAEAIASQIALNDSVMVRKYKAVLQAGLRLPLGDGLRIEREAAVQYYKGMATGGGIPSWRAKL